MLVSFPIQAVLLFGLWAVGPAMPWALAIILGIALTMYVVSTPCISLFMTTAAEEYPQALTLASSLFMTTAAEEYPQALTLASSLEPTAFNVGIAFGTAVGGAVISGPGMPYVGLVGAAFSLVAWALAALTVPAAEEYPQALTLASSLEPTAFNVGIAFGTAVGGAVISGPGMPYVGLVGAAFSLVAWALAALTVRLATKRR